MNIQQIDNNLINKTESLQGEDKFLEEANNNTQQNINLNNNQDLNIKDNPQEQNILQNQNINNLSNEEIILKINNFLQQNQLDELSAFLSLNKNIIPKNVLSSYISIILIYWKYFWKMEQMLILRYIVQVAKLRKRIKLIY